MLSSDKLIKLYTRYGFEQGPSSDQCLVFFSQKGYFQNAEIVLLNDDVKPEEIDWYILHQANRRILEAVAKRMGEPVEKFPRNMEEYGNTSSASIPILLDEMNRDGRLKRGQKIVLAGFGAGLTWGATIIEW